jgi:hypothetical protein
MAPGRGQGAGGLARVVDVRLRGEGDAGTGHVRELEAFVSGGEGDDREGRPRSHVARSYRSTVRYEAIAEAARTGERVAVEPAP